MNCSYGFCLSSVFSLPPPPPAFLCGADDKEDGSPSGDLRKSMAAPPPQVLAAVIGNLYLGPTCVLAAPDVGVLLGHLPGTTCLQTAPPPPPVLECAVPTAWTAGRLADLWLASGSMPLYRPTYLTLTRLMQLFKLNIRQCVYCIRVPEASSLDLSSWLPQGRIC